MEGWKERMKGTLVKRKRSESAREQGGGFEGRVRKLVFQKGGKEVLQQRWWRQKKADEGR